MNPNTIKTGTTLGSASLSAEFGEIDTANLPNDLGKSRR